MISVIHFQHIDDDGERLKILLDMKKPFVASVVPVLLDKNHKAFESVYASDYYYPAKVVALLKNAATNSKIIIAQEGYVHYCSDCFNQKDKKDPYHEHMCLDGKARTLDEQKDFMEKGRKLIQKVLGVLPQIYCPPNHLFNEDSLNVAQKLGFKYFLIRAKISLPAYKIKTGLIIIPEAKLNEAQEHGINAPAIYTYYDYLKDNWLEYSPLIQLSPNVSEIFPLDISKELESKIKENEELKLEAKKKRDLKKQNKLPIRK